ncbi:TetR/AcrR family transcriptional regulator C-terminal domain-containing protein, partial [Bradyrhizobium guangdongense]|uniref:TetR/AcrR family transcriptional regulator C-terminal domain-containing protein n=1 Tax=Bradyrhizobium guangdongense TaxID=1325090 RepID=UPI0018F7DFB1
RQLARQPAAFCRQFALDLVEQWSDPREHQFQKVITAERNRVPGIRAKFADHFYAREQSMMTDYFRGFALAGLISTPDPRETARLFAAGLIYIRLEHYVMGAASSPRPKVIEAIDRYLAFFLSLIAAGNDDDNKKRKPKGETRGKAASD